MAVQGLCGNIDKVQFRVIEHQRTESVMHGRTELVRECISYSAGLRLCTIGVKLHIEKQSFNTVNGHANRQPDNQRKVVNMHGVTSKGAFFRWNVLVCTMELLSARRRTQNHNNGRQHT